MDFKEWKASRVWEQHINTWHPAMSNEDYHHSDDTKYMLSSSGLKIIGHKTPAHWKYNIEAEPEPPTPAMVFGSAFHSRACGFYDQVAVEPAEINKRTKVGKAEYAEFVSKNAGKSIINAEDSKHIDNMIKSIEHHKSASVLLRDDANDFEWSGFFKYPGYDFPCKIRPDIKNDTKSYMADLKSCQDASPEAFGKTIANYLYHWQGWHYISGMMELNLQPYSFYFIAVEKTPPYAVGVYYVTNAVYSLANEKCAPILEYFSWCWENDAWPAYDNRALEIDLPGWAFR